MTDIVERLNYFSLARSGELHPNADGALADEAADEIKRLRAEIERLRGMYEKSNIENDELRANEDVQRSQERNAAYEHDIAELIEDNQRLEPLRARNAELLAVLRWFSDARIVDATMRERVRLIIAKAEGRQ